MDLWRSLYDNRSLPLDSRVNIPIGFWCKLDSNLTLVFDNNELFQLSELDLLTIDMLVVPNSQIGDGKEVIGGDTHRIGSD